MIMGVKVVVQLKLTPSPTQAAALEATLHACNQAANHVSDVAFAEQTFRNYALRRLVYAEVRSAGIGSQAAQHVIKKVADAYTALRANIRNGNYGPEGSKRRKRIEAKPIVFRDPAFTSRMCAECGHTDKANRVSQAFFACRSCGVAQHADRNASRNIAARAAVVWNAGRTSHVPVTGPQRWWPRRGSQPDSRSGAICTLGPSGPRS